MLFRLPILLLLIGALLAGVAAASVLTGVPVRVLTGDPTATAKLHPLTGVLSNLGVLLWAACAAACALAGSVLWRAADPRERDASRWLAAAAALTAALSFDDLFLIHEDLGRRYLGVTQTQVLLALVVAACAYLLRFRRQIAAGAWGLLLLALSCFVLSLTLDAVFDRQLWALGGWEYFAEDAPKFAGIAFWCAYHCRAAGAALAAGRAGWPAPREAAATVRMLRVPPRYSAGAATATGVAAVTTAPSNSSAPSAASARRARSRP
jgi:hypothetical protein